MIYIVVLIYTLFLFFWFNVNGNKKGERFHYNCLLFFVCCLVGFSYRLGMDTTGYMENFDQLDSFSYVIRHLTEYRYEPAFVLFLSCCKTLWNDFTLVQFVVAIFVNSVLFWFAKQHSKYYFLVIFIYFIYNFWNFNFEIKRESIAVCFFLLGIHNIMKEEKTKKDYLRYLLFCTLCASFHHFGILSFFFILLTKIKFNRIYFIILFSLITVSIVGALYLKDILNIINQLMALYTGESLDNYLESGKYGASHFYTFNGIISSLLIPLYIIYNIRNRVDRWTLSFSLSLLIFSVLATQVFILYRLQNYMSMFLFLSYAKFAEECCQSRNRNAVINRIVLLFVVFLLIYGKSQKQQYIRYSPYSSIFTKEINADREAEFNRIATEYLYY